MSVYAGQSKHDPWSKHCTCLLIMTSQWEYLHVIGLMTIMGKQYTILMKYIHVRICPNPYIIPLTIYSKSSHTEELLKWWFAQNIHFERIFHYLIGYSIINHPFGGFLKWKYPQIILFNKTFHSKISKPFILGYPQFRKPPFWGTPPRTKDTLIRTEPSTNGPSCSPPRP